MGVPKFMATGAGHVIAAQMLFNPTLATWALLEFPPRDQHIEQSIACAVLFGPLLVPAQSVRQQHWRAITPGN